MAILLTHIFEPTSDGVLDPKEHRKLANECPALKLPGVIGSTVYRHTGKSVMIGAVELENYAALDSWESWWWNPEGREWVEKFESTGKFVERITFEKIE